MPVTINGTSGITTPDLDSTADISANSVPFGRGAGSISTNTAAGAGALASNTSGGANTAIGVNALNANTTGGDNTAVGRLALQTATGSGNTAIGENAGNGVTTGSKNTLVGRFNGNQGGLDIRTSSNFIVLSDGDGNPRFFHNARNWAGSPTGTSASIVDWTYIIGQVATNYSGTRYMLVANLTVADAFNMVGDINASSWTTWNICNVFFRKQFDSTTLVGSLTGIAKSSVTVSLVDITFGGVRYAAIKFAGGDPSIKLNVCGERITSLAVNGAMQFIEGTAGVTENSVIASY